jgi:carbamoyltransferase
MIILGLNAYHPDSSACLIVDGELIAGAEEERFRRIKHWAGLPTMAIEYCLKEANLGLEDVDHIALNRDPRANLYKKAVFAALKRPSPSLVKSRLANMMKIGGIKESLAEEFALAPRGLKAAVHNIEHHRSHLASSFFVSPFQDAAAVSIDGFGDFTSCMVAKGEGNSLRVLYEVNFPHSLGLFYTAFTQYLGFKRFGDEYKVMGLSAYGEPRYAGEMEEILTLEPKGRYSLDMDYFSFHKRGEAMLWNNVEPAQDDAFSGRFIEKFGPARSYEEELEPRHCDMAASLQAMYEKAFFHVLNHAHKLTGNTNLCLAGGCALNSLANGRIFDMTPFKEIYIQPASSDAGGSLGAGFYLYHQVMGKPRCFEMSRAYWGPSFSETEIENEIEKRRDSLGDCIIERAGSEIELCKKTAGFIAEGKVIGWFQGRMEWGPRALGNRSVLVDPRRAEMKDILNERIKRREWFRPFAPSILLEKVGDYFEKDYPDPFMIKVYPVKVDKREKIPAVTHVDGTGRLQTVSKEEAPLYWRLIKEFEDLTGVPVVLNTSFNENEPIVCTPGEAIDCFMRTKMDVVVLGGYIISRDQSR